MTKVLKAIVVIVLATVVGLLAGMVVGAKTGKNPVDALTSAWERLAARLKGGKSSKEEN